MSDWSSGYVADIGYTYGYYPELNPLHIKLAFLNAGIVVSEQISACELGFGQGLSVNIHAAASATKWFGTDFNPSQASYAQELGLASQSDIKLYDEAFSEFTQKADLPDFDYIGLHGIWSWISDENRALIVDFIRRKLRVGGVLYISYNTLPGWGAFAPLRHLMVQHAEVIGSEGRGIISRIDGAIEFADKLFSTNPLYAQANSQVQTRVQKLKEMSRHYLAHEYFNRDWHPMHFSTMAEWLEPAKLQFACSANYLDSVNAVNITAQQQEFLAEIPDEMFRQSVRDFIVNQQFRKDYWVKGLRKLSPLQQAEQFRKLRVILIQNRPDVSLKVSGALGEATMNENVYSPILDFLADHTPKTLGQIEQNLAQKGVNFGMIIEAMLVLSHMGVVASIQDEAIIAKARKSSERLNNHLIERSRDSNDVSYLASPVTGGGVAVGRFQQLFLLAIKQGKKQPQELAKFVWELLAIQGQKILKDGKSLDTVEDNIDELTQQAQEFLDKRLKVLKALQIV
jgi:SAM-dependent methyltransferase